jgi:hypothetical protein
MKNSKVYVARVVLLEVFSIRVFETPDGRKYACLPDVVEVIGEDIASLEVLACDRETHKPYFPEKCLGGYQVVPLAFVPIYWALLTDEGNFYRDEANNTALRLTRTLMEKSLEQRADEAFRAVRDRKRYELQQLTA